MRILTLLLCLFAFSLFAFSRAVDAAGTPGTEDLDGGSLVRAGTEAYQAGKFEEAVSLYERAVEKGISNGRLKYNLGNAYFRTDRLGRAIASYRSSLVDLPNEIAVRENLALARARVKEALEGAPSMGIPLSRYQLLALTWGLDRPTLRTLFYLCYVFFWTALVVYWWRGGVGWRRWCTFAGCLSVWLALPLCVLGQDAKAEPVMRLPFLAPRHAVVVNSSVNAYAGDGEAFQVVTVLHDGAEVTLSEEREAWCEVLLENGRKGWVKHADLRIVED